MSRAASPVLGLNLSGEAGRRIRDHAWERTPLGPLDQWPQALRLAVGMILDHPMPMVLAWGPALCTVHNNAYLPLLRGKPSPLGRPFLQVWSEARETIGPQVARALAGQSSRVDGARFNLFRRGHAEEAFFDYSFSPLRDEQGRVVGVLNTAVETTQRVLAERRQAAANEALRSSEMRFRALVTAGGVSIYRMSPEWRLMYQLDSQSLAPTSGPIEDWPAKYILEEDRERVYAAIEVAIRTRSVFELEHRVRLADGTIGWVLSRAVPLLDAEGEIVEWFGAGRDVTDRRQMQERQDFLLRLSDALRPLADPAAIQGEAARLLREYFDTGWCCYAEFDDQGKTATILEDATRAGLPSLAGRHDLSGVPDYVEFLRTGQLLDVPDFARYPLVTARAIDRYCALGIRSLLGVSLVKEGRLVAQLVMLDTAPHPWPQKAVDIIGEVAQRTWAAVERARAEQSLGDELARQKQAERRKDEFLAVLGHELRNPLAPISTGLALLDRADRKPQLLDSLLPMLHRQVVHLNRLVDDLLDMSRVSRGNIALRKAPLDLNDAVEVALEQVRDLIAARRHALTVRLCGGPVRVDGDSERLTQVVANLLTNAAKYSMPGGHITVRTEVEGDEALVGVQDRGYGIPPERLQDLFDMFVQVPEHRQIDGGSGGLGIGLALASQLVRMHGGSLKAFSEGLGHGSEFIARLPLDRVAPQPPGQAHPPADARPARRILVVDDNVDAAQSLEALLSLEGHQVEAVHDGPEALRRFDAFRPDLVLLDLGLPGWDGLEVARRIRGLPAGRHVPLVAVSGWGQAEDRRRTREAGFNHHLTKPVEPEQLLELICQIPSGGGKAE